MWRSRMALPTVSSPPWPRPTAGISAITPPLLAMIDDHFLSRCQASHCYTAPHLETASEFPPARRNPHQAPLGFG
ncbi:hypothetical protein SKAU_G00147920 [Synaphobranchus kaupii]|uniref:Uncharacterized protein n=1 Tax=Synaphobranchus kaupii TaxID=118154 RepID=A0A9Q1J4N2_SYNKA|nr:hypothetical protein SKAU_G00147920 [Synaphobranchus kaupii]